MDVPTGMKLQEVAMLVRKDPLYKLSPHDAELLREFKYYQKDQPMALAKCLRAVDWSSCNAAHDVADMVRLWAELSPEDALDLLDAGFADQVGGCDGSVVTVLAILCVSVCEWVVIDVT